VLTFCFSSPRSSAFLPSIHSAVSWKHVTQWLSVKSARFTWDRQTEEYVDIQRDRKTHSKNTVDIYTNIKQIQTDILTDRNINTVSQKSIPRKHSRLWRKNQLTNSDNFWYEYIWHNLPPINIQFSISINVYFCTTWGKHNQQNITFLSNVIWLLN